MLPVTRACRPVYLLVFRAARRTLASNGRAGVTSVFFGGWFLWDAVKDGGAAQRCDYGLEKRAWLDDCTFSAECRSSLYHLFCLFLRS